MTNFADMSAIYAYLDRADERSQQAAETWVVFSNRGEELVTTNYVVVEAITLADRRLGRDAVHALLGHMTSLIQVHWVDERLHQLGLATYVAAAGASLSLGDCVSFEFMRQHGIDTAFAFDRLFEERVFATIP